MRFLEITSILLLLSSASAIRIECDYVSFDSMVSECNTEELEVKFPNETVTSISGKLMDVLIYENIKSFKIVSSPLLEFLPKGLEKFFPNLEKITITQTGLRIMKSDDLKIFPKLKNLVLRENKLKELEASLFEFNREIEEVDLSGNQLKHLGGNFLKFAENLKSLDMSNNDCVNGSAKNPLEFKRLKIRIENCPASSDPTIDAGKFTLTFLLMCFAVVIFALIIFNCIKFVVK